MPKRIVLAVDDEPLVTRLIQVNLERAGYSVHAASNGIEALEALQSGTVRPDLILMDVTMPYMDGIEALQKIKADPNLQEIPVIMLTARSRDADIMQGQQKGASHYLFKPIHPTELLDFVRKTIGESDEEVTDLP